MSTKVFPLMLSAALTLSVLAEPMDASINLIIETIKQNGELSELAQCIDQPEAKVEAVYRKSFKQCLKADDLFTQAPNPKVQRCIESMITSGLNVSKSKMESCEPKESKAESKLAALESEMFALEAKIQSLNEKEDISDAQQVALEQLEQKLETLTLQQEELLNQVERASMSPEELAMDNILSQVGENGPTAEQQQEIERLQQVLINKSTQQMNNMLSLASAASQGTEDQITLPIYKNSQIIMHMTQGMGMGDSGMTTLPAATFAAFDSLDTVFKFYQSKLSNFQHKKLSENEIIFMEKIPFNFNVLTHMEAYMTTPHVLIRKANGGDGMAPENTQTLIEIAYKR